MAPITIRTNTICLNIIFVLGADHMRSGPVPWYLLVLWYLLVPTVP